MVKIKFVNNKPVRLPKYSREGFYYDGKLLKGLERQEYRLEKNFDNINLVVGGVGTGKTTYAFGCMDYMLKGKLTLNNIFIGSESCIKGLVEAKQNDILMLDDAGGLFFSSEHNKKEQKTAIKLLHLCRSKNLTIYITAPDLFKLTPYLINQRAISVTKIYVNPNLDRGRFAHYGVRKLKALYRNGKKNYNNFPKFPKPDIRGIFDEYKPSFQREYDRLKQKAMEELGKSDKKEYTLQDLKPIIKKCIINRDKLEGKRITNITIAKLFGIHAQNITNYCSELRNIT